MIYLISYLILINLLSLLAFRADKKKSEKGTWRTKEITLLSYSLLGGGLGSMLGMSKYRHKTKKMKFQLGVPFLTVISIFIIWFLISTFNFK